MSQMLPNSQSKTRKDFIYPRVKLSSNPVPLDEDSDSDFNPGSYIPEPTNKGRKKRQSTKTPSRKRRNNDLTEIGDFPKQKRMRPTESKNPLLEYFGDLGLQSASEEESPAGTEEEDHEEDLSDSHSANEEPGIAKTDVAIGKSQTQSLAQDPGDDSLTEPESDLDTPVITLKRKSPIHSEEAGPSLRKIKISIDTSETEPESGEEDDILVKVTPSESTNVSSNRPSDATGSDSTTEPESDDDVIPITSYHPKPAFQRKPTQPLLGPLVLDGISRRTVPASINTFLREYQRDGIRFFWDRYKDNRGGLLGDDMGLVSKTIQVISFLSAIMSKHGDTRDIDRRRNHVSHLQDGTDWRKQRILPPANKTWPTCLIIAPSSVVGNWEREFQVWGYFEVGLYIGSQTEREPVLSDFKKGRLDVVLTSFDVARREINLLDDLAWSCIIVDEVHRVKNPRSKLTEAFSQFACNVRFGLTGTAIQNSYEEMWTILNWTNPNAVGTLKQWQGYIARPLTVGQSSSSSEDDQLRAVLVARILKEKLLPKFFLRRTKYIIKDQLPKKFDEVVFCPLTQKQIEVYKRILNTEAVQNMICKDDPCDCGSNKMRKACCHPFEKGDLFKYMSTLIKISNHLALILPAPTDSPDQIARNRELSEIAFSNESIPKYGPAMLIPRFCGKWLVLETLLKEWRKDLSNKVLIFTKSVKLLEMLEFHLRSQSLGYVKLDGSTKQRDRMPLIDRFQADPDIFIFLISTLAGGVGLNLAAANKVVIFDPNWNPAHDLQAMDRAYRFGQTRDVSVYRLLGAGSVEELIYARQIYKQQQMLVGYDASLQTRYFEGVQGAKDKQGELFGIKNIFRLHESTLATKMAIENATLVDLDWAFAHMDAKKKTAGNAATGWVYEAEIKGGKEHGDLRGLGALLFDDESPKVNNKNTDIEKTLNDIGVNYTHRNEDLIVENAIEGRRIKIALEEKKKAIKKAKSKRKEPVGKPPASPEPEWPPKRRHHKAPPSPRSKLFCRQIALIDLEMIKTASDLPVFAQQFARKSEEEQSEILARLDQHAKQNHLL